MAIWQVPINITGNENGLTNTLNYPAELFNVLPEENSWCKSIRQFGHLDSTCLEIDADENDILLRLDLRSVTKDQLKVIIEFVCVNEMKFKYKTETYDPSLDNLIFIIKESDSYRFLNDPNGFLETLNNEQL